MLPLPPVPSKRKSIASEIVEPKEATVEYKTTSHFILSYDKAAGRALAYGVMDSVSVGGISGL